MPSEGINFSEGSLWILNGVLAFIMFGVALDLTITDFKALLRSPVKVLAGLASQFILLPAVTLGLVLVAKPEPQMALGMFLVAACPGGNMSNFITALAKGNVALSVSLTALSSLLALLVTPLNFAFWAGCYGPTGALLQKIQVDVGGMMVSVAVVILLPLVIGMTVRARSPEMAQKIGPWFRKLSLGVFIAFLAIAFAGNFKIFMAEIGHIAGLVAAHNGLALAVGFGLGTLLRFPLADRKTLAIETGIQNSGLGLGLIFTFFGGMPGMALIAAWWGIWHLISGMAVAAWWGRRSSP